MRRLSKVSLDWSNDLAYAIGLITSDGNLSPDGRHINLTSKDVEIITNFQRCLVINNKIGKKSRGGETEKRYYVIQFGDKNFYNFLLSIGLTPAKSKTMKNMTIPRKYFFHFLRGCIDGDGNIDVGRHAESKHPQLRLRLCAYNPPFLEWIRDEIRDIIQISGGWICNDRNSNIHVLAFGKSDSIRILKRMYRNTEKHNYLSRKLAIAQPFLGRVVELVYT